LPSKIIYKRGHLNFKTLWLGNENKENCEKINSKAKRLFYTLKVSLKKLC